MRSCNEAENDGEAQKCARWNSVGTCRRMATRRLTAFRRRRCRARRSFAIASSQAAEAAGFEYLLIPVGTVCWEAWITGAFMAARSSKIKPLIAARPGYINPVLLAKMISTFDQMSGGRICINLIAGQNESEVEGEGIKYAKEERYELMEEEVRILKLLWTNRGRSTSRANSTS